jgi:hypothetical protein
MGGNNGLTHDHDFSPFEFGDNTTLLATASADGSVRALKFGLPDSNSIHPACTTI